MGFIQYELKRHDLFFYHHENDKAFYPKDKYAVKTAEL